MMFQPCPPSPDCLILVHLRDKLVRNDGCNCKYHERHENQAFMARQQDEKGRYAKGNPCCWPISSNEYEHGCSRISKSQQKEEDDVFWSSSSVM
mmetsp:Transcript_2893/g.4198  ORF Transcript_2893/g.4198 Transcript_2893/m.4198 type:complete len:94 (-) Transcript_2893:196-477(-)